MWFQFLCQHTLSSNLPLPFHCAILQVTNMILATALVATLFAGEATAGRTCTGGVGNKHTWFGPHGKCKNYGKGQASSGGFTCVLTFSCAQRSHQPHLPSLRKCHSLSIATCHWHDCAKASLVTTTPDTCNSAMPFI